jgi:WS/DGAT/MGAT family acyltransferase
MSPVDTTWLRMGTAQNLMQVVGLMIFSPPVDVDRIATVLAERIGRIARFRERAEERSGSMWWIPDPDFDLSRHIRRLRLPGPGGKSELQRFVSELSSTPLDPNRPLWQFHLVEDYAGGAAVVARIHHAIGDGIALVRVLLSLMDESPGSAPSTARAVPSSPVMDILGEGIRLSGEAWRGLMDVLREPENAIRGGAAIAGELAYLMLMPSDSDTRYKGRVSGSKRVAWSEPMKLPEVSAVSDALGCSINDLLLAAVAGALGAYLSEKGDPTDGVEVRAIVPVNLRPEGADPELGNRFGVVAIELPLGLTPLARVYEVRRRMDALKRSYEAPTTFALITALGFAPKMVQDQIFDLLLSRATAVMTNVPGPRTELRLAECTLTELMFWVPQAGAIGMGVSILSYHGKVQFGLMTDTALVPDPDAVVARFNPEFEKLLYFVLLQGTGAERPAAPAEEPAPLSRETRHRTARKQASRGRSKPR